MVWFVTEQPSDLPDAEEARLRSFSINYSKLYDVICDNLRDDQTTLLLYLLLHRNKLMKAFILSRTNMDQMVSPYR